MCHHLTSQEGEDEKDDYSSGTALDAIMSTMQQMPRFTWDHAQSKDSKVMGISMMVTFGVIIYLGHVPSQD